MADSQGIFKQIRIAKETAWGVKASAAGASSILRRTQGNFNLEKEAYSSNEIRTSQQVVDMRHGTRKVTGNVQGELGSNSYTQLIAAGLRRDFTNGAASAAVSVTVQKAAQTFTRGAGSWLTDGYFAGSLVRTSGAANPGNNGTFVVKRATATVLSVEYFGDINPLVDVATAASITFSSPGKESFVPATGHTDDSFTVEEWMPDVPLSQTTVGNQVNSMSVSVQPNQMVSATFDFMGKDADPTTTTQFFTAATAQGATDLFTGSDGIFVANGIRFTKCTGINIKLDAGIQQEAVIGSNAIGAKSRGKVSVTLDGSVILDGSSFYDFFNAETEVEMIYASRTSDGLGAVSFYLPNVKIGAFQKDDGEKVIIASFSGTALEYNGTAADTRKTTIQFQDAQAV